MTTQKKDCSYSQKQGRGPNPKLFFPLYVNALFASLSGNCVHSWCLESSVGIGSLKLELRLGVKQHVDATNQTQVLCKSITSELYLWPMLDTLQLELEQSLASQKQEHAPKY